MNKVKYIALAIVASFATTAAASEIDFHGYTRAGIVLNQKGGSTPCFHLGAGPANIEGDKVILVDENGGPVFSGADTDYRLGNECDWVIEPNFDFVIAKLDDKSVWGYHIMPNAYRNQTDNSDLNVGYGQVYFYGANLPWLANGELWAGKRFLFRLQTGINDQFLENEDSIGFGAENMDLGFGKLSLAAAFENGTFVGGNPFTSENDALAVRATRYGILGRLTNIQTLNKDSNLQIWAAYYGTFRNTEDDFEPATGTEKSGFRIAAYHTFGFGTAGNLLVGAKYAKNDGIANAEGSGGPTNLNEDVTRWQIVAQYGVNVPSIRTSVDVIAEYRSRTRGDFLVDADDPTTLVPEQDETWWTAGFRTDTQLSGPFRFLLEVGYDAVSIDSDVLDFEDSNLLKITPCLAISGGNDAGSRPTFRLFYTYATWSDVGALSSNVGRQLAAFSDKKSGGSFGVQAEGWW